MSEELVTFHFRYQKALYKLKIKFSLDVFGFIENLKNELKLDKSDDIVILYPVPSGKMMEIQSNEDFEFVKNNKLTYDAVNKEINCSVELMIIFIHNVSDEPKAMFKNLWNKLNKLESQVDKLSDTLNKKMDENDSNVISSIIRSILAENSQEDLGNRSNKTSLGEPSKLDIPNMEPKDSLHQKTTKMSKDNVSSISTSDTSKNSTTSIESFGKLDISTTTYTDILVSKLLEEGYTNTIQNIIVLMRFDNNYKKAVDYLKSHAK